MRRRALERNEPRSTRRRILEGVSGVVMGGTALFVVIDQWFGLRELAAAMAGYGAVYQGDERATEAIQSRFAGLETAPVGSVVIQRHGSLTQPYSTGGWH